MKICVAQTRPVKGDILSNIANHKKLIDLAIDNKVDTIVFPELSLTGYEPELAKELAADQDDSRLDVFQEISDANHITIGVGMPTKGSTGILISMIIFQPHKARQIYSKQYLHADEDPFFVSGHHQVFLTEHNNTIAPAICYELSVPEHAENAHKNGAGIYLVSVAKTASGVEKAFQSLAGTAKKYSMTVLMSNCLGHCDNFESAGNTAVWNNKGQLVGQLNDRDEGILIFDTDTQEIITRSPATL